MDLLRTPDLRFANLPGYPYAPNYVTVGGVRIHHVDAGPRDAPVIVMLHGEPSWSFLYRKMIGPVLAAGFRVVVPDLVGFGRSDKPSRREEYTYQRHVDWMRGVFDALALQNVTLFCQDWGGLIGLRLVGEEPSRFARVVASNTFLPTGDQPMPEAFLAWQQFSQQTPVFPVGAIVQRGSATGLSPEVVAAYDAPFPDESFKEGARQFPMLVPTRPDDPASAANRVAWEGLRRFDRPFLTAFGDSDPITRGADAVLQKLVPGAAGQAHVTVKGGGHFIQEDRGEELADILVRFARGL